MALHSVQHIHHPDNVLRVGVKGLIDTDTGVFEPGNVNDTGYPVRKRLIERGRVQNCSRDKRHTLWHHLRAPRRHVIDDNNVVAVAPE